VAQYRGGKGYLGSVSIGIFVLFFFVALISMPVLPQILAANKGAAWNFAVFQAATASAFGVDSKHNCIYCGGYHYDCLYPKRNYTTTRVNYYENENDVPLHMVYPTQDEGYDRNHEEFVAMYFSNRLTRDDFYRMCKNKEDRVAHEVLVCALAEAYTLIRGAQTAFILFSTFLDLRPVSAAHDAQTSASGRPDVIGLGGNSGYVVHARSYFCDSV
jgi:hypothetical protein